MNAKEIFLCVHVTVSLKDTMKLIEAIYLRALWANNFQLVRRECWFQNHFTTCKFFISFPNTDESTAPDVTGNSCLKSLSTSNAFE